MNMQNTYSVLLVEDEEATRSRLARVIVDYPNLDLFGVADNCEAARRHLDLGQPDVMLVDLGLPDGRGTDLIREIAQRGYQTEVMVITVFNDEKHVVSAIEAGATGYLLKDGSSHYIGDSIFQMLGGGSPISASIARHLLKRFQREEFPPESDALKAPKLTDREAEVLRYIAKGFSQPEIASILELSPHTVASHVKHIYRKLAVRSRGEAVYEAIQMGLIGRNEGL